MTTRQSNTNTEVVVRDVCLSDLYAILRIYKEDISNDTYWCNGDALLLQDNFGLPVAVADCGKEIAGYAAVCFPSLHKSEIQLFFKQGCEQEHIKQSLHEYAQKMVHAMTGAETQNLCTSTQSALLIG